MDQQFYKEIKRILETARQKAYSAANFAMVDTYWNIGRHIVERQGGDARAEYGAGLIKELSEQLTKDFGRGFTVANLKNMRQFYLTFPNGYTLCSELSWSHYRLLMRVENANARGFYLNECVKSRWSTRQLERQINTLFYERLLSSRDRRSSATSSTALPDVPDPIRSIRSSLSVSASAPSLDIFSLGLSSGLVSLNELCPVPIM